MAPEYIQTGKPDPRSDIFAVGVILYETLTGFRPFDGDTSATVFCRGLERRAQATGSRSDSRHQSRGPEHLTRAMAKNPSSRFPSAELLAAALRAARDPAWRVGMRMESPTVLVSRNTRPAHTAPKPASRKGSLSTSILLVAGIGISGVLWRKKHSEKIVSPWASQTCNQENEKPVTPIPMGLRATHPPPSRVAIKQQMPKTQVAPIAKNASTSTPAEPEVQTLDRASALLDSDPEAALKVSQ